MNRLVQHKIVRFSAVYAVLLLLVMLAPDPSGKEAQLLCGEAGVIATYSDMNACSSDPRFKAAKCSCFRPPSEWTRWYGLAVVPIVGAVLGYLLFQGSLGGRLLLLNAAAMVAFVTDLLRLIIQRGAVALYALPSAPISLLVFLASISIVFLSISWMSHLTTRSRTDAP
jgi:hypothetical protein